MTADLPILLLALLVPVAYLGGAAVIRTSKGLTGQAAGRAATLAAGAALLAATALGIVTAIRGGQTLAVIPAGAASPSLTLDAVSLPFLILVSFVGLIVTRFSRNYLEGDQRQPLFFARLMGALAVTTVLALAGDLIVFAAGWVAMSLALHGLLVFYPERPLAQLAARKKFIAARLGDACIILAFILLWQAAGTTSIGAITAKAAEGGLGTAGLLAALLIGAAALMKSAQFPFHGWITEVMETPTPVSALLHAGIVNAGGFAVLRFSGLFAAEQPALWMLAMVGGGTALFASVVMLTQPRIKTQLAWSTIAQMGFMMLQCGLGSFASAMLHIIAHSLYKAHAFLWAGSAAETVKRFGAGDAARVPARAVALGYAAALAIFAAAGAAFAGALWEKPGLAVLGSIIVLGLGQMAAQALASGSGARLLARTGVIMAAVSAIYFALHLGTAAMTSGALAVAQPPAPVMIAIMALVIVSFTILSLMQALGLHRNPPALVRQFFVHAANGFYANAAFNRIAGALRINPNSL